MENAPLRATSSYTTRLDRTLTVLQDRVKEQEAALEEVRAPIPICIFYSNND
jgi:hypothetical protein